MQSLRLRRGNKRYGPFSSSKIKEMISAGKIKATDLLQIEGTDDWIPVKDIPSLASGVAGSADDSDEIVEEAAEEVEVDSEGVIDAWEELPETDEEYESAAATLRSRASTLVSDARSKGESLAAKARSSGEGPIEASDGLLIVVWKLFVGAREFRYHEPKFPALSACLRIGALGVRLWLVASLVIAGISGAILCNDGTKLQSPIALRTWCSVVGADSSQYFDEARFQFDPVAFALGILPLFLWFLIVFGVFEVIRLLLTIERNTRG